MQAIAYSRYGSPEVLGTVTLPRPDPKPGEVLVRIRATTVTAGDYRARSLDMPPGFGLVGRLVFGLLRPRRQVLGAEFSGVVEAVGSEVTRFAPGDRVFAYPGAGFGGYAEYAVIAETGAIAPMPEISISMRPRRSPSAAQPRSISCATRPASSPATRSW
jgi:NADPH:quinone reductase-like Zn-dependent oxidoreductase